MYTSTNRIRRFFLNTPRVAITSSVIGLVVLFTITSISSAAISAWLKIDNQAVLGCGTSSVEATVPNTTENSNPESGCGTTGPVGAASTAETELSAGAHLPISYDITSLAGNVRYVATSGNDNSVTGSDNSPYATVAKAYGASASGDSIVVRGGTYHQGDITISPSKPVRIIAYPGETPVFSGAAAAMSGWTAEGSLRYHPYTAMPVTNGSGINFTTGQNLAGDGVGKYPDQAWVGNTQLKQVTSKGAVTAGKFYVEGGRLYLADSDVAKDTVEFSNLRNFINIQAPGTTLEGIKITRYSNSASDYGVVKINPTADKTTLRNVEISDTSFIAATISGSGDINTGTTFKNVTIGYSNWMGVNPNYTDNMTFDGVYLHHMNQWGEFTYSPQSGAIKTSRTRYTKVINSKIQDNQSHGIWFDQSNYDVEVANNVITGNLGSSVFFEISDKLTLVNNYIVTPANGDRAVKLAGSSGLRLVNNTIIGGADPIGIYVDNRSKPGCADPSKPLCANSYGSDRDTVRPYQASMDWVPRLDMMVNNIVAYPKGAGYCGTATAVCITQNNGGANVPLSTVIHPKTIMSGNVYANGTGTVISTPTGKYAAPSAFAAAMAGSVSGLETAALSGNTYVGTDGTPTAELAALHSQASAVPNDATVNQYVPAGAKHYGVTFK